MPVMTCIKNGKAGYKWGESGKCYTGEGARLKARDQGKAIKAKKYVQKKKLGFRAVLRQHQKKKMLKDAGK